MYASIRIVIAALLVALAVSACSLSADSASDDVSAIVTATPDATNQPVVTAEVTPVTATATITPSPTATQRSSGQVGVTPPCVGRTDWPAYTVVAGDTLSALARRTGSTVTALSQANCLSNANLLEVGQSLRVPRQPGPDTFGALAPSSYLRQEPTQYVLVANSTILLTWQAPLPPTTARVHFFWVAPGQAIRQEIGVDTNVSDGKAEITYTVLPAGFVGVIQAAAMNSSGAEIALVWIEVVVEATGSQDGQPVQMGGVGIDQQISGDAGYLLLVRDAAANLTWPEGPSAAARVNFYVAPTGWTVQSLLASSPIASDTNPADGISAMWSIPPSVNGHLMAVAQRADGTPAAYTFPIHVNSAPAQGQGCSITPTTTVSYFAEPNGATTTPSGTVGPQNVLHTLGRSLAGWWAISTNVPQSGVGGYESLFWLPPETPVMQQGAC